MSTEGTPSPQLVARVERLMHRRATDWRRAAGGYTPAERWIAGFADGSSCFVKAGVSSPPFDTAGALRAEYERVYSRVEAPWLARLLAWEDDPEEPVLILEDLSAASWPPPWTGRRVELVLETLAGIHAMRLTNLPGVLDHPRLFLYEGWTRVEADPEPFLSLGLCTRTWLDGAIGALQDATQQAVVQGDDTCHFDIRSDNLCFAGDRVVVIDWNNTARGNGAFDTACWLPSLAAEGGPLPESVQADQPGFAAMLSGYFARHAGLPPLPRAPNVRRVQLAQLQTALAWAVRALGLPPLDGPKSLAT